MFIIASSKFFKGNCQKYGAASPVSSSDINAQEANQDAAQKDSQVYSGIPHTPYYMQTGGTSTAGGEDFRFFTRSGNDASGIPVIPLPNPGEGGPVWPGNDSSGSSGNDASGVPVIPLPNPGEGGPVWPGSDSSGGSGNDTSGVPVIPLPNPGEGGPVWPGNDSSGSSGNDASGVPVIPLPNPGEGGPVWPGPGVPTNPGQIIPVYPIPNPPCFFCQTKNTGQTRFLNAVLGYEPFRILINRRLVASSLGFSQLTSYGKVSDGFQTITVAGQNGYIYLQKTMPFRADDMTTIAIIKTASGIDLLSISDAPCRKGMNMSCLRACNLAYYSDPLDIMLQDGRIVYSDIRYKEVTALKRIRNGSYQFYITETASGISFMEDIETLESETMDPERLPVLTSFQIDAKINAMYTIFLLNWDPSPSALKVMITEDLQ